jgi:predicted metalloprotease with PDZ domain
MLSGRRYLGVTVDHREETLVVRAVQPHSPAHRAGLAPGDRLMAMNGRSLANATPRDFKQILADARETGRLFIIVSRRGAHRKLEARLEPYSKEQIAKIVAAHLSQSHTATAGAH